MTSTRHRWGKKVRFEHKSEQQCVRCETVMVGRRAWNGVEDIYWCEFWRDEEKIAVDPGKRPPCDARCEPVSSIT